MLEAGTIICDRYKILRRIGEGGMGAVYEAEHTGVGRRVAVKVLLPEFAKNQEVVARFEREARAAAEIGHDNIIDVLDVGNHEGQPFMVMEFLKGESLAARIERQGKLTPESAAYVMGQVLSALGSAHAVGIIHRDLKPDNVFLTTKAGMRDFVKLLDFGISKFKDDGKGPATSGKTQTGALMGTPVYMSPEQATAKRDIDHRADLYSAGVMLYEMVTGQVPFDAESAAELLMAIVYRPNGVKSTRDHNPEIPPEFDAVVMKAMAKERDDRYQDASEFVAAITPWMGSPPLAADSTGAYAIPKPASTVTLTPTSWEKNGTAPHAVSEATPEPKKRTGAMIGGAFGAIALVAIAAFAFTRSNATPTAATSVSRASVTPAALPAPSPSRETPAPARTVAIDLAGLPAGAHVEVDGHATEGAHLVFERDSRHTLRVTADGRTPYESSITADRDREIMIALAEAPAVATTTPLEQAATEPTPAHSPRATHAASHASARSGGSHASSGAAPSPSGRAGAHTNATPLSVSSEF
jgi:serine/threonine-protein kinase